MSTNTWQPSHIARIRSGCRVRFLYYLPPTSSTYPKRTHENSWKLGEILNMRSLEACYSKHKLIQLDLNSTCDMNYRYSIPNWNWYNNSQEFNSVGCDSYSHHTLTVWTYCPKIRLNRMNKPSFVYRMMFLKPEFDLYIGSGWDILNRDAQWCSVVSDQYDQILHQISLLVYFRFFFRDIPYKDRFFILWKICWIFFDQKFKSFNLLFLDFCTY